MAKAVSVEYSLLRPGTPFDPDEAWANVRKHIVDRLMTPRDLKERVGELGVEELGVGELRVGEFGDGVISWS